MCSSCRMRFEALAIPEAACPDVGRRPAARLRCVLQAFERARRVARNGPWRLTLRERPLCHRPTHSRRQQAIRKRPHPHRCAPSRRQCPDSAMWPQDSTPAAAVHLSCLPRASVPGRLPEKRCAVRPPCGNWPRPPAVDRQDCRRSWLWMSLSGTAWAHRTSDAQSSRCRALHRKESAANQRPNSAYSSTPRPARNRTCE